MSDTTDFFDNIGTGPGAPSPVLKNPGDWVAGEIVEMFKRDYIPYENRKSKEPAKNDDGTNKQQLVIVLQTTHRNWENVSKVPKVDPSDDNSPEKAPSEDDGKRALYVPEGKNIQFAIGRACVEAKAKPTVGGTLAVKVFNLKDTGQGQPLKEHEARYTPPSAGGNFFESAPATAAPAATPAPAAAPAAAAPAQSAPAGGDPWATPGTPTATKDEPPF